LGSDEHLFRILLSCCLNPSKSHIIYHNFPEKNSENLDSQNLILFDKLGNLEQSEMVNLAK
jgi:hypothetical protein